MPAPAGAAASADASPLPPPQLRSAARGQGGALDLVWTSGASQPGLSYLVEVFASDGKLASEARVPVSAARLVVPPGDLFWRVTAIRDAASATSYVQRIPAASP